MNSKWKRTSDATIELKLGAFTLQVNHWGILSTANVNELEFDWPMSGKTIDEKKKEAEANLRRTLLAALKELDEK